MSRLKTIGWYALKIKFHVIYVTVKLLLLSSPESSGVKDSWKVVRRHGVSCAHTQ